MSEASEPVAPGRRRSSVYDPARDVFQLMPHALPPLNEEDPQASRNEEFTGRVMTSSPYSDPTTKVPPTIMTSEINNKRRRSPSPTTGRRLRDDDSVSPRPGKKRRSSLTQNPVPSPLQKGTSSFPQKLAEPSTTTQTSISNHLEHSSHNTGLPTVGSRSQNDDQISTKNNKASPSEHSRNGDRDSNLTSDRNGRRTTNSQQHVHNEDRNGTGSRRSRPRSPVRRRSPLSSTSSAYRRRDARSPPRRSRSPSPIRRSPPPGEQLSRRPGGGTGRGRNVLAVAQRLAEEREREQEALNAQVQRERGVQHMSNQFYNSRPEWVKERGRDWRKNESKIKGLRSFNNWIKSCIIQKFSPEEAPQVEEAGWGEEPRAPTERKPLLVLDIGCGKGGDLGKWQLAPQTVGLYVGLDPADQSIAQAQERYGGMRRSRKPIFDARFHVKDCFGDWIGDIPIIREVGIDPNAGHGGPSKWSGGGFDVVTMMFSMHYAFENEQKARTMLRNVSGSLKKGGRFIGVVPNSDVIAEQVVKWCKANNDKKHGGGVDDGHVHETTRSERQEASKDDDDDYNQAPHWGNSLYNVRFGTDRPVPRDGIFRDPPFGWKYMYWMEEAVDVPEYVVPWEAFRAVAEGFNLEQRYRKPFLDIWETEKDDRELSALSVKMGVRRFEGAELGISDEEREAVRFYHAFCFVKV